MLRDSLGVGVMLSLILFNGCPKPENQAAHEPSATQAPDLKCELLSEEIYDVPIVTRVIQSYLVEGDVTEENLKDLLMQKYQDAANRSGFEYHEHPTAVNFLVYTDREYFESSPTNWLARLQKTEGSEPNFYFNEQQFDLLNSEPVEKLGMSEEQRMAIWHEICWYEEKARAQAEEKYPDPKDFDPCWDYEERLIQQYRNEITSRHSITYDDLMEIYSEGSSRGWPYPPTGYEPPSTQ